MCQIDFDSMKQGNMDMDLYKKILKECSENAVPSIKLNYRGEPTMNKRLPDMIRLAKEAGILEVQLNTNGVLINEKLAGEMIDAGLDRIKFSIDGATAEVYEKIRGTNFERVVSNVQNFVRIRNEKGLIRPIVHVQMVYMKENQDDAIQFVHFWKNIVNRIGMGRYRSTSRNPDDARLDEHRVLETPVATIPCAQLWQRLLITFDGTVVMCCGDQKVQMPVGDVTKTSLKEIWRSPALMKYRAWHMEDNSRKMTICPPCEMNKTDPKTAQNIWAKITKKEN
jgi:radical SAM protein with 4Fe4S-binding SPASM domain